MNYKTGLQVIIMLFSIIYQIWVMLTVSLMLFYEHFDVPYLIKIYAETLNGFIERPWEIPSSIWFFFILGGVCLGLTLASYMIEEYEKISRHYNATKEKIRCN